MKHNFPYLRDTAFLAKLDRIKVREEYVKIISLDFNENPLEEIQGKVISGSVNIVGGSALRRTCSFDMYVDENSVRDYFYISDFADGLDKIIQSDINKEIFNIGSGIPTSLRTVIDLVEKDCQKSLTVNKLQIDDTAVKSVVLDISKLKNMVGYEPKISLQDGIRLEVERLERGI